MTAESFSTTRASSATTDEQPNPLFAVIDIGATSIRMAIAQVGDEEVKTLENLSQAVSLGKDVFARGEIDRATLEDCVRVLKIYRHKLDEYQLTESGHIRVVATSAVREAGNRLAFLDRIYIATGFEVEPFDEAELHRVTYLGIQPTLRDAKLAEADQVVVCEVGGGSTEVLVVRKDNVVFSQTSRLGSLRLSRTLEASHTPTGKVRGVMEHQAARVALPIRSRLNADQPIHFVAMGGDVRFAVAQLTGGWQPRRLSVLALDDLIRFTNSIAPMTVDDLVKEYHLSLPAAETLVPALLAYIQIAKSLDVTEIHVADVSLRGGLLREMASSNAWTSDFSAQILRSAKDLGRKFHFDETHAQHVAELCGQLFVQIGDVHRLDGRYELLLRIAGLLHEIGSYVSHRSLHKHSMYLIRNSDLFGLGKRDLLLVSLAARYHRRASPQPTHEGYSSLTREDRVAVAKMAAILRIAKALDDSRSQRIKEFRCRHMPNQLVIEVPRIDDLSLEQVAMQQSGSLFDEIFGKRVVLRALQNEDFGG